MTSISAGMAGLPHRPHALYRFFDRSDVLLYVGITADVPTRFNRHRREKPWWTQVHHVGIEHFDSRREAFDAEAQAIRDEQPLYNSTHNRMVEGGTDSALANTIVYGVFGIEHGSDDHRRLVQRARARAEEDEREFGDVESEVAQLLVMDLQEQHYELYGQMRVCASTMLKHIPAPIKDDMAARMQRDFDHAGEPEPSDTEALPHMVRIAGHVIATLAKRMSDAGLEPRFREGVEW